MAVDLSAAAIKEGRGARYTLPRRGSQIRVLYDLFVGSKPGETVVINPPWRREALQATWGLQLRRDPLTHYGWVLVGQWTSPRTYTRRDLP